MCDFAATEATKSCDLKLGSWVYSMEQLDLINVSTLIFNTKVLHNNLGKVKCIPLQCTNYKHEHNC